MTGFLNNLKKKRTERHLSDREKYLALVRKAHDQGKLSAADEDALDKLATSLGFTFERIEADLHALATYQDLSRLANELPGRRAAAQAAVKLANDHAHETEKLIRQREGEDIRLRGLSQQASSAADAARAADDKLHGFVKAHWELLGIKRTTKPAHLCDTHEADRIAHTFNIRRREIEELIGSMADAIALPIVVKRRQELDAELAALPQKQKEAVYAMHERREKAERGGVTVFIIDPDRMDNFSPDIDGLSFSPAPGQTESDFNELLSKLRQAVAQRDAHAQAVQSDMRTTAAADAQAAARAL